MLLRRAETVVRIPCTQVKFLPFSQAWMLSPGSLLKQGEVLPAPGLWAIRDWASLAVP